VGDAVAVCRGIAEGGELVAAAVMKLAASDDDTKIRYVGGGGVLSGSLLEVWWRSKMLNGEGMPLSSCVQQVLIVLPLARQIVGGGR
jgi:hypothetical protein